MIINGFNTAGKSGADLLSFGSGGADWSKVGIFNKISADQLANAYLRGDLFGLEDGFIEARKSGEYTGTFNDWRNEKLHEVFGVEYDKPSGWANKSSGNQTCQNDGNQNCQQHSNVAACAVSAQHALEQVNHFGIGQAVCAVSEQAGYPAHNQKHGNDVN